MALWIRKLHRMGTSVVLTIPVKIMDGWTRAGVRYVTVDPHDGGLLIHPLTTEDLMYHPAPEEEEEPHGEIR